jgi:aryl-alcohol dehydrogenase-like predicted oxidoreductase
MEGRMRTRRIGSLEVSVVGLGCNNFGGRLDQQATDGVVGAALEAGVTLFDTADIYGGARSEEFLAKALGHRRDQIVLATKFGVPYADHEGGASPTYVRRACEDSLRRLETDHIDLYQLHFPDPKTPMAETLGALDELVREGKAREIGCSNMTAAQLEEAAALDTGAHFVSVQNNYSILHREPEAEVLPACDRLGMAFLPYFPLANGLLTGKYRRGEPPPAGTRLAGMDDQQASGLMSTESLERVASLGELAAESGHTVLELAIAWLLLRPAVASVIAGATRPEQVRANVTAAAWEPDAEVAAEVDRIAPRS